MLIPTMRMLLQSAGSSAFSPIRVPNLVYWGDADNVTIDTGVDAMTDLSGSGNTPTQATTGNQFAVASGWRNGYDALQGAAGKYLRLAAFAEGTLAQANAIYIVGEWSTDTAADNALFDSSGGANRNVVYKSTASKLGVYAGTGQLSVSTFTTATPFIWRVEFNGASTFSKLVRDGGTDFTNTWDAGALSLDGMTIGADFLAGGHWLGKIASVAVVNGTVSAEDDDAMFEYFSAKYNIVGA
jgi:hypothetical protein